MISIQKTPKYDRARDKFVKNNPIRGNSLLKVLQIFTDNPSHPSLHLEKLSGLEVWTIRIDRGNRIFFQWLDESTAIFIDIDKHDKYRNY